MHQDPFIRMFHPYSQYLHCSPYTRCFPLPNLPSSLRMIPHRLLRNILHMIIQDALLRIRLQTLFNSLANTPLLLLHLHTSPSSHYLFPNISNPLESGIVSKQKNEPQAVSYSPPDCFRPDSLPALWKAGLAAGHLSAALEVGIDGLGFGKTFSLRFAVV